jgi:hypothetical protein
VITAGQHDKLEPSRDELRYPERCLVRFRPGAAEEADRERIGRKAGQPLCQHYPRLAGEPVADLHQPRGLLPNCLGDFRMRMAGAHAELPGFEVEEAAASNVPQLAAAPPVEDKRRRIRRLPDSIQVAPAPVPGNRLLAGHHQANLGVRVRCVQ